MLFQIFEERLLTLGFKSGARRKGEFAEFVRTDAFPIRAQVWLQELSSAITCFVALAIAEPSADGTTSNEYREGETMELTRAGLVYRGQSLVQPWAKGEERSLLEAWEQYVLPWLGQYEDLRQYVRLLKSELEDGVPSGFPRPSMATKVWGLLLLGERVKKRTPTEVRKPPGHLRLLSYAYFWLKEYSSATKYLQETIAFFGSNPKNVEFERRLLATIETGSSCNGS